jgi:hypothetical protein
VRGLHSLTCPPAFRIFAFGFLISAGGAWAPAAAQDVRRDLEQEIRANRVLELEYQLVKDPKMYLVFRLSENRIEFRIRGLLLREVAVREALVLGRLPEEQVILNLRTKETERPPQRSQVNPQEAIETTSSLPSASPGTTQPGFSNPQYNEPDMLELSDMPSRYNLVFDGALSIMIRPAEVPVEETGFRGRLTRWGVWWSDTLARLRVRMGRSQVPQLRLSLADEDCRRIFWSFNENAKALFVP